MLNIDSQKPLVVADIGCRWGFAERFLTVPDKEGFKIYGFDPDEEECRRLQQAYKDIPEGIVTCVPIALAGQEGMRNLYITKQPACSSLHPPIQYLAERYPTLSNDIKLDKITTVNVTTIEKWAAAHNVDYIDYLKIDTQGSELEILTGAGALLESVRCIDIEVEFNPIYEGQTTFGETDMWLRSKGFTLWRLSHLVHYSLNGEGVKLQEKITTYHDAGNRQELDAYGGQLFWADAKYIRMNVLHPCHADDNRRLRDIRLFNALGMLDIVRHIELAE